MSDRLAFEAAVNDLSFAHTRQTSLCRPFLSVLPVSGAAISTLGRLFGTETISATDAAVARLDELQIDLGEGPCWDAAASRRPVLVDDIRNPAEQSWPALRKALTAEDIGAVYAFPLTMGSINIGAVDLYSPTPGSLTETQVMDAVILASIAARQVLRRALSAQKFGTISRDDEGHSRRIVHQATGMVLAQLNLNAADALLTIHGHAFASGQTVRDVAADVVTRKLDFSSLHES